MSPDRFQQNFANMGQAGRIIVVCEDGPSLILAPGEQATVWVRDGRFWHAEPTPWRRLRRFAKWFFAPRKRRALP